MPSESVEAHIRQAICIRCGNIKSFACDWEDCFVMTLRGMIIAFRKEYGLSQRQFADKCGLSNGYISMLEKNKNPNTGQPITPGLSQLQKIAFGMGHTVPELFSLVDEMMQIDRSQRCPTVGIGNRLKDRRKELGLSAEQVAEMLAVSPATIYRYENGDIDKVPGRFLVPLAKALSTTPHYLVGWEDVAGNQGNPEKVSSFAARLLEILQIRDITQAELSRRSGIGKSSLTRYIKGDWEGKQDAVYKLALALDVSEAWLMGYDVPLARPDATLSSSISPLKKSLLKNFDQLNEKGQERLVETSDDMVASGRYKRYFMDHPQSPDFKIAARDGAGEYETKDMAGAGVIDDTDREEDRQLP